LGRTPDEVRARIRLQATEPLACFACGKMKDACEFGNRTANVNRNGKAHACRACVSKKRKDWRSDSANREMERLLAVERAVGYAKIEQPAYKKCTSCHLTLELIEENFYKAALARSGFRQPCKSCWRKRSEQQRLPKRYGITVEEFRSGCELLNHTCTICLQQTEFYALVVDHSHATGALRGLICWDCNLMLGMAKDDSETLDRARHYLEDPPGTPNVSLH
jgi:hypothetical protein